MGTKNNPGDFDCYANAEPDEPMFILLARDEYAPALIRRWARKRAAAGEDPAKVEEARACAKAMEEWRLANRGGSAAPGGFPHRPEVHTTEDKGDDDE
jgi:hypothetical protein